MPSGLRILAYDKTLGSFYDHAWVLFAKLAWPWFEVVLPVGNWGKFFEGCARAVDQHKQQIGEIQLYGHGKPGQPLLGGEALDPTPHAHLAALSEFSKGLAKPALLWLRMGEVFFGQQGKDYAEALSTLLGAQVAGHTYRLGWPCHSGLHTARPGILPAWSIHEGRGPDSQPERSYTFAPRTICCLRMTYPPVW